MNNLLWIYYVLFCISYIYFCYHNITMLWYVSGSDGNYFIYVKNESNYLVILLYIIRQANDIRELTIASN